MRNLPDKVVVSLIVLATANFAFASAKTEPEVSKTSQIIISVVNGRVRSKPSLESSILYEMKIGTRLQFLDENKGWFKIGLSKSTETDEAKTGWISKTISAKYDDANPDPLFQEIANRYINRKSLNFGAAKQVFEFLGVAANDAKTFEVGGDLRLKRFITLSKVIEKIGYGKTSKSPHKEFLAKYNNEVIYHEPDGVWITRSERLWELHQRYRKHKVGEKIAWYAANNPLPGECEGYVVCHVNYLRVTSGEYLNFYPNGKYSKRALTDITNLLQPIVVDLPEKRNYYSASDITDRAVFNRILSELRTIISRTPFSEKNRTLKQIAQIAEGHR